MEKRKIVLVDDHVIVRNGLKALIEKLGDYSVIAELDSGMALLDALPLIPVPDLLIIDLNMPGMGGDALVAQLRQSGTAQQRAQRRVAKRGPIEFSEMGVAAGIVQQQGIADVIQRRPGLGHRQCAVGGPGDALECHEIGVPRAIRTSRQAAPAPQPSAP